jgi:hypothetical protein
MEEGFDVVTFEQTDSIGGTPHKDLDQLDDSTYDRE